MTATTNGAAPEVSAAPPGDLAARQVGDQRIDRQALDGYLDAIFGDGTGYAHLARGTKPYLTESGRYAFGRNWREDAFAWPAQRAELVKIIARAVADDADVYLCPYLMKGEKRTKGTAVERRLVHADIDGEIDVARVTELGGFAVSSGSEGHGHVYVALSAPVDAHQHEALCRALGRYLGNADSKVSDNDVLRPPGTVNRKPTVRGGVPVPVRWLVETVSRRRWNPAELAAVLGIDRTAQAASAQAASAQAASAPAVGPVDAEGLDAGVREALALHIPREDGSGDDRSRIVFRVLQACYRAGMDSAQAEAAVRIRADLAERLEENPQDLPRVWIKVVDQAQRQRQQPDPARLLGDDVSGPGSADRVTDDLTERRRGELTHADQAAVLARDLLADRWVWTSELGWLHFDGCRWRERPMEAVRDEIAEHYRGFIDAEHAQMLEKAGSWNGVSKADQDYLASLRRLLSKSWLDAVTSLAAGKVRVQATDFDAHPDLLNVANGVVNLATGALSPHDPALLLRKITPVAYRPEALADPDLARILQCLPDQEVRGWLQIRFGQAATGYVPPDDLLILLQGGGANGKSTLMGVVHKAFGEYAVVVDDKVLLADTTSHSTERMELFGARFGLTEEVPGGRELDMNKVKKIVGTPFMQARRMQRDPITWAPTHALVITTNNQPVVRATDHGAWRRLAKVVFPLRYRNSGEPLEGPDDRRADTRLRARMEAQDPTLLEAVLAWLVDGARRWYAADRVMPAPPARVQEDTRAWRWEADLILQFIDEFLILEPDGRVLSTDVYEEFTAWLEADGHRPWAANVFKTRLLEHPAAQATRVTTSKTRDHTNLSRPQRKAHMITPSGPVAVLHNIRFRRDNERHLRVLHNPRQEQLFGLLAKNPT